MERLIFHVDVNSAFLSWEAARRVRNGEEDIRLVPSAVGGDPESRRSIILAKSVPAKKYGITTGEPVSMALRKCPGLLVVPSDFSLYVTESRKFKDICRSYAPGVEEYSIDEVFCDFTGTGLIYPDPIALAYEIKDRIKNELGFTVNIGIGNCKTCAKMAGDFEKPDKVHTLFDSEIRSKMWPLPVGDLIGCGKQTAAKLKNYGIYTIGDLAGTDRNVLRHLLGQKLSDMLYEHAHGIDDSPVLNELPDAKGYSNETTLEDDLESFAVADNILLALSDSVGARIRAEEKKAGCITVTVRGDDFKKHSHQRKLLNPTDITSEIFEVSKQLFRELWDGHSPLRLLGVGLTDIEEGDFEQMSLFSDPADREKERKADIAMDSIRKKFGKDAVIRGMTKDIAVGKK